MKQKLDYDNIISGTDLDMDTYNAKFVEWDRIVANNELASTDDVVRVRAYQLLLDPTVYAYAYFRDDEGQPFRMTAYQDAIVNCIHDGTELCPERFILFKAANQIGKSKILCLMAIYHAFNKENVNIVMVSKSLPQSQFLLAQIRHTLNNSKFADTWRENIGETANTTVLSFKREFKDDQGKLVKTMTNRIICAPMGEGLLGYPVHYLYLDEADFYEDAKTFFWKVGLPRTNKTKGQIILFSNPNPDISRNSSLLWELWSGKLFKRKFSFNFLDAPWNSKLEYTEIQKNSPSYIFASTHDGEFPEEGGGFFKHSEIQDMMQKEWHNQLPIVDRPIYIGLDLAKVRDQSVLVIGTSHQNQQDASLQDIHVLYMMAFPQKTDYIEVVKELERIYRFYQEHHHGVAHVGFDATGVGKGIDDFIKFNMVKATPIDFNLQSKSRMYGNFKMLSEQRRIRIVYDINCEKQLAGLVFERTARGYLTIKHEKEQMHDDYPDAIVCLIDVALNPSRVKPSIGFVSMNKKPRLGMDSDTEKDTKHWVDDGKNRPVSEYDIVNDLW